MKRFFIAVWLFCQILSVQGQQVGVTGRIIDSASHQPIEYATISLFEQGHGKPVGGTITGNKGSFSITGLSPGHYTLAIECIGYSSRAGFSFALDGQRPATNVGDIALAKKAADLQAVTVTAPRDLVENKLDKMVYNAEKEFDAGQ